ncbi:Splicing regulator RBM11 [Toxocara canis]|uniref:Splicing regulator RBM11 n=1 Tax=Toxocara canis TaxID=6265 RepID=A0A0B2W391_TOXCA|nr:Splicing regulator RBM11 [Toxocara canis]
MFTHAEGGHDILRKLHLKSAGCISKFRDLLTRLGRTEATLLRKEERIAMRNSKSDEGRSVFVTNIENGITIDMLFDLLAQFGWLEKVELKETRDGTPLYAKGFFKYREAAQRAVDVLNQKNIFGRPISLCISLASKFVNQPLGKTMIDLKRSLAHPIRPLRTEPADRVVLGILVNKSGITPYGEQFPSPSPRKLHQRCSIHETNPLNRRRGTISGIDNRHTPVVSNNGMQRSKFPAMNRSMGEYTKSCYHNNSVHMSSINGLQPSWTAGMRENIIDYPNSSAANNRTQPSHTASARIPVSQRSLHSTSFSAGCGSGASHFPTISSTGDDFATPNVFPLPSHEGIIWSPNDGTETSSPLSSATSEFHFRY